MDSFAKIFINYQKLGKAQEPTKRRRYEEKLAPWRNPKSKGRLRADIDNDKFSVKFLGVWDTVGALGLPEEIPFGKKVYNLFGFNDSQLGDHIERACQALALNERRLDFNCNKFQQTDAARTKGQYLKQVWFAGCHTDVGGGYDNHDLSDLALVWMASELDKYLSLDLTYLQRLLQPVAPLGVQQPHDSSTGIFTLAATVQRALPEKPDDPKTHEFIHESVREQKMLSPKLSAYLESHPDLICPLEHYEKVVKETWPYDANSPQAREYAALLKNPTASSFKLFNASRTKSMLGTLVRSISGRGTSSVKISVEEPRPSIATMPGLIRSEPAGGVPKEGLP